MAPTQITLKIKTVFKMSLWQVIKLRISGLYKNPNFNELITVLAGNAEDDETT